MDLIEERKRERKRFRFILEALPLEVPVDTRLKRLLKFALRVCGFRCEAVEEIRTDESEK